MPTQSAHRVPRIAGLSAWEEWFLAVEQASNMNLDGEGDQEKLNKIAKAHGLPAWEVNRA